MTKIIDIFGEEARKKAHERLDEFFDSGHGFFIMSDDKSKDGKSRVTDLYANVCHNCVITIVHHVIHDAASKGLLALPKAGDGHKH